MFRETLSNAPDGMVYLTLRVSSHGNGDPRSADILARSVIAITTTSCPQGELILISEWNGVPLRNIGMDVRGLLKIAERFLFSNRCKFCETLIPIGDAFCPKCGKAQV